MWSKKILPLPVNGVMDSSAIKMVGGIKDRVRLRCFVHGQLLANVDNQVLNGS